MYKTIEAQIRRLISLISILLLANGLFAQPAQHRMPPPQLPDENQIEKMVDELAVKIKLSPEQKENITDLFQAHFTAAKKLINEKNGDRENQRQAMGTLKARFEKEVKARLKEEQQKGFDEFMKSHAPQAGPLGEGSAR